MFINEHKYVQIKLNLTVAGKIDLLKLLHSHYHCIMHTVYIVLYNLVAPLFMYIL
jgi:hypothetical protein